LSRLEELRHKKGLYYISAVFLLLLAAAYVYLIQPLQVKVSSSERKLVNDEQQFTALQAKLTKTAEISDADRIKLDIVRRQVPEQPYAETIVRDLRRLEVVSHTQLQQYDIVMGTTGAGESNGGATDSASAAGATDSASAESTADSASAAGTSGNAGIANTANSANSAGGSAGTANTQVSGQVSGNVLPIQIQTSFVGTYAQIYQLLAELESLDRLIQVDKVTFNLKQDPLVQNAPEAPVTSNLTLTSYYSPTLQALLQKSYDIDFTAPKGRINPFS